MCKNPLNSNPVLVEGVLQEIAEIGFKGVFGGAKSQIFSHKSFSEIESGLVKVLDFENFKASLMIPILSANGKAISKICTCKSGNQGDGNVNNSHNVFFEHFDYLSYAIGFFSMLFIVFSIPNKQRI